MPSNPQVALVYDESAYVETISKPSHRKRGAPQGLMGRQVAGREYST
jgi:hypothetical protein